MVYTGDCNPPLNKSCNKVSCSSITRHDLDDSQLNNICDHDDEDIIYYKPKHMCNSFNLNSENTSDQKCGILYDMWCPTNGDHHQVTLYSEGIITDHGMMSRTYECPSDGFQTFTGYNQHFLNNEVEADCS